MSKGHLTILTRIRAICSVHTRHKRHPLLSDFTAIEKEKHQKKKPGVSPALIVFHQNYLAKLPPIAVASPSAKILTSSLEK